jgi:hypothetical protein
VPTWVASFTKPATLTGLVLSVDSATSLVSLAWTASTVPLTHFFRYEVERQYGEREWERADSGELTDRAAPTFVDEEAPAGALVRYRVRQNIGSADDTALSDPLEGELTTPEQWAVVVPGDRDLTEGDLRIEPGATQAAPWSQDYPRPLGRQFPLLSEQPRPIGRIGRVFSLQLWISRERRDLADKVFDWEAVRPYVVLKDPDAGVFRVVLSGWAKQYQATGIRSGSLVATEVA